MAKDFPVGGTIGTIQGDKTFFTCRATGGFGLLFSVSPRLCCHVAEKVV